MLPIFTSQAFFADERSMLEDAALLRLQAMYKAHGGPLELVSYYNGELQTREGQRQLLATLLGACPAILLACGESSFEPTDLRRRRYKEQLTLHVLVASRHLNSTIARNRGDIVSTYERTADPGVYALMSEARGYLTGWDPSVAGMEPLQIVQQDPMFQLPELTLWRVMFRAAYSLVIPNPRHARPSTVPITGMRIRHHHTDDDGDGVSAQNVVVHEIP